MESFCSAMLVVLGQPACALSVAFVAPRRIREVNRLYRGTDAATDVLSFGYGDESIEGLPLLGEVVISPGVACAQAREWRTPFDMEMRRLLVHGILHLVGYDHETDQGEMMRLQRRLLRRRAAGRPPKLISGAPER